MSTATENLFSVVEQADQRSEDNSVSRPTSEIVIGLVGAVGSGVSETAKKLKKILESDFAYSDVSIIKASDLIRDNQDRCKGGGVGEIPIAQSAKRILNLQEVGNKLRGQYGDNYIACKVVERIALQRQKYSEEGKDVSPSRRTATIIDSLKNPSEYSLFREVYGDVYWQFTVFAPEKLRGDRLRLGGVAPHEIQSIFYKDDNDGNSHGQNVRDTAHRSDFFIRNDGTLDNLDLPIRRFLELIFNLKVSTPTADEFGLYMATSSASKSGCLSRQVGAAAYSASGELLGVGWNDVPCAGGGLYSADSAVDKRCINLPGSPCSNDLKKKQLYENIFNALSDQKILKKGIQYEDVEGVLKKTPVRDLIEYSRSIHAEMEAILSAGRSGKSVGLVGGTLYTTTFPCHNCARHIVAAGLERVIFVEPYAKSLALELHDDAIATFDRGDTDDGLKRVMFQQYQGVAPWKMFQIFQHGQERKEGGKAIIRDGKIQTPIFLPPADGFAIHEARVAKLLSKLENKDAS